jgi:hypothetical protein
MWKKHKHVFELIFLHVGPTLEKVKWQIARCNNNLAMWFKVPERLLLYIIQIFEYEPLNRHLEPSL